MREAVAAVFVHDDDIFIIRRQDYLRSFPGYHAFPGGTVDAADAGSVSLHPLTADLPARHTSALIRELREELNFDLEQSIDRGDVVRIVHFGVAVTPPVQPLRYNAHYIKVVFKDRPRLTADSQEIAWAGWLHRQEIWQRYLAGQAMMVAPTMNTLRALAEDISAEQATPFNLGYAEHRELPRLEFLNGLHCIPVPSNTLPPARATNALIVGDPGRPRILVDPSPQSPATLEMLINTLREDVVDRILITHHHPDHHEYAPELARRMRLPILCSERTRARLNQVFGTNYLDGVSLRLVSEGERVTSWLGRAVRCHALPGHDDGMLGLAAEDMSWFFVADLVHGMATVVIPESEGDMKAYFDSLQRVIELQPRVVIPSHGMPVGGTVLLEQTLAHRIERERQVRVLWRSGSSVEQMVNRLYDDLEPRLLPLARQNVTQHLRKLGLGDP